MPLLLNNMMFKVLVQAGDLKPFLSGGATNINPDDSLGGVVSAYDIIPDGVMHNLFDAIPSADLSGGNTDYRCYYLKNTSPTETWVGGEVYIEDITPSADTQIDIGLDPAGVGDGVATGVATTIANDEAVPAAVVFTHTVGAPGLSIGDLDAGEVQAIWIRRVVTDPGGGATAAPDDRATLRHTGSDY